MTHAHRTPEGVRRRRWHRPPRGAAARPDRPDAPRPRRVRRRRRVPPRRQGGRAAHRRRGQRGLLPRLRRGPRPGRGLPVHDADLRRGRGVRRPARAAPRDAPQPGAARQVHARPRRDDRRARSAGMVGRLGRRRRDRPARLVRRAHHLHVVGLPHRPASSATSSTPASPHLYHDLEQGTDAIAYVDPYADIESFRRRDAARVGLVELVQAIMDGRRDGPPATEDDRDLLDVLMSIPDDDGEPRFTADEVTGMFISMMFAGHHTTSGTAAWTLIELLRHPEWLAASVAELDALERRGRGRHLPGAARDPAPRVVDQGGAAAAPAADPAAAGRQRALRRGGVHIAGRQAGRRLAGGLEPASPRTFPDADGVRPRPLLRPAQRGRRQPVELDPVRRRPPPLRRARSSP